MALKVAFWALRTLSLTVAHRHISCSAIFFIFKQVFFFKFYLFKASIIYNNGVSISCKCASVMFISSYSLVPLFLLSPFFFTRSPNSTFMFSFVCDPLRFMRVFTGKSGVCLLEYVSVTNDYTIKESISPPQIKLINAQGVMGPHEPLLLP